MTITASARGRANRNRGVQAERDLVRWLRTTERPWPVIDYGDDRLPERFWRKVYPCSITGCWHWGDREQGSGYGQFRVGNRRPVAHRYLWEQTIGPVAEDLQLDHLCRVRCCVNPAHLEPVTAQVNNLRSTSVSARYARRTHCDKGHEFTPENTYQRKHGARECATCTADRMWARRVAAGRGPGPAGLNLLKTHCLRGHDLAGENVRFHRGRRHCRTCERERMRRVRAVRKASA